MVYRKCHVVKAAIIAAVIAGDVEPLEEEVEEKCLLCWRRRH
jgi:hypothetical protein